jgi:hypothetical protein
MGLLEMLPPVPDNFSAWARPMEALDFKACSIQAASIWGLTTLNITLAGGMVKVKFD